VTCSGSSSARSFTFGQHNDEHRFRLRTDDTGVNGTPDIESPGGLTAAEQHVVVTYDGVNVKLYRNGNLETTEPRTGVLDWDAAYHLLFGQEADGTHPWLGTLSRVSVYDQGLTAGQVANLFNDLPPGPPSGGGSGGFKAVWVE